MFSLYVYQFKWFNKLQFLVFIEFLESIPPFMEMGFVNLCLDTLAFVFTEFQTVA